MRRPYSRNTTYVECKNKSDTSHKRVNWKHLKITQKISKQPTRVYWEVRLDQAHAVNMYIYIYIYLKLQNNISHEQRENWLTFSHRQYEGSCICRNMLSRNVFLEHGIKGFANGITTRQLLALPYQFGICDHQDTLQGVEWCEDPTLPDRQLPCCNNLDGNVSKIRRATLTRAASDFRIFGPLKRHHVGHRIPKCCPSPGSCGTVVPFAKPWLLSWRHTFPDETLWQMHWTFRVTRRKSVSLFFFTTNVF